MFITITGELGSGKSTAAKLLHAKYGFEVYSTGSIQREIAKEKGISTLELNRQMTNDIHNQYDKMIDDKTIELASSRVGENIVFDSRMAWHFVEQSFKVYVTVDPYVAAERVMAAERGTEEQYRSVQEAAKGLMKRKQLEDVRFAELYHVHTTDFGNYDLIVDSTFLSPDEAAGFIFEQAGKGAGGRGIYLSPRRLFPTKNSFGAPEKEDPLPIEAAESGGFYYILQGHGAVCEGLAENAALLPVLVQRADDAKAAALALCAGQHYREWETQNGMRFLRYPQA